MLLDRRTFIAAAAFRAGLGGKLAFVADLQAEVTAVMEGRAGCAVVLDVESGRMRAQANPDVAAQRLAPPGSVVKPFALAALLEAGIVLASTRYRCQRILRIAGRQLDCSHIPAEEAFDPMTALAYSCNDYFARFAARLAASDLVRTLTAFGLTSPTGLAPREAAGRIASPADTAGRQLLTLGEAGIVVTPLGIASAFRRLAGLRRGNSVGGEQLSPVFEGLAAAADYGTARLAAPPGGAIAGKTGTATDKGRGRAHAWFAGYAPAARPQAVVVIFLENGSGGGDAAPLARRVFAAL